MVKAFCSEKIEQLIQKFELSNWHELLKENFNHTHQDMSDNWKMYSIGEQINLDGRDLALIKGFSPEAIKLGYDFSVAMQEKDNQKALDVITKIKQQTIWRNK